MTIQYSLFNYLIHIYVCSALDVEEVWHQHPRRHQRQQPTLPGDNPQTGVLACFGGGYIFSSQVNIPLSPRLTQWRLSLLRRLTSTWSEFSFLFLKLCSSLNVMIPSWQYWHISRADFYWFSIQADWEGKTPAHFAAYNGFAEELHLLCTRFLSISPLILSGPAYLGISKDQGWGVFFPQRGYFWKILFVERSLTQFVRVPPYEILVFLTNFIFFSETR